MSSPSPFLNLLHAIYRDLEIDPTTVVEDLEDPNTRFLPILKAIAAEPAKHRHVTDKIVANTILRESLPIHCRSSLSSIYPEDKELALQLLIGTTSYYKFYDRCDTVRYRNIVHCPDYYFMHHFFASGTIATILKEHNVDPHKFNELWAFYNDYMLSVKLSKSLDITE